MLASQIFDVLFGEAEVVQIFDELLKPGKQRKAAVVRDGAEKHIEHGDLVSDVMLKIAVRHRQLIKVGEHRQVSGGNFVFDKLCGIHMYKPSLSVLPSANCLFYYIIYKTQFQYRFNAAADKRFCAAPRKQQPGDTAKLLLCPPPRYDKIVSRSAEIYRILNGGYVYEDPVRRGLRPMFI